MIEHAPKTEPPRNCPYCGAIRGASAKVCWLCDARFDDPKRSIPAAAAAEAARSGKQITFSLSTMLLAMTVCAVMFALIAALPGLGVPVAAVLVPVMVKTVRDVGARERAGLHVSTGEKVFLGATLFVWAVVFIVVILFTAFCCFCSACAVIGGASEGEGRIVLLGLGAALAAVAGIFATRGLLRYYRRRQEREDHVVE